MYRLVGTFRLVYTETPSVSRCHSRAPPILPEFSWPALPCCCLPSSLVHSAQAQTAQPPTAAKAKPAAKKPAPPKAVAATPAASGPCIGVFPLLADRFQVRKIGITVFGNEFKQITVDNWGLDDLVVERVRAAVGPSMAVRRIAHAKGAFRWLRSGDRDLPEPETRKRRPLFDRPRRRRNASATWS